MVAIKRCFASAISIILLLLICAQSQTGAATTEFLQNGDFETLLIDSACPAGWTLSNGSFGENFVLARDNVYSGNYALRLLANGKQPYITQTVDGLTGGAAYTLSAAIRASDYTATALQIKLEFYSIDIYGAKHYIDAQTLRPAPEKNNQWQHFSYKVTVPADAYAANVLFRLPCSTGEICYDKLTLAGDTPAAPPQIDPSLLPVYTKLPPAAGAQELIINGDMENPRISGLPKNWFSSTAGTVEVSQDAPHSGQQAIRIQSDAASVCPYASYYPEGLVPNATYQLSIYLKIQHLRNNGFGFELDFRDKDNAILPGAKSARMRTLTGNNWLLYTQTFRIPPGATRVGILFRLFGVGTLYIDDASFYMVETPYRFDVTTDECFYYTGTSSGTATVTCNPDLHTEMAGKRATFSLYEGETPIGNAVHNDTITISADGTALYTFPTDALVTEKAPYCLAATVDGETKTEIIYRYPRPSRLDAEGVYHVGGKAFNPILLYHINAADYKAAADAGFTLVQGIANDANLTAAANSGVMLLATLYSSMFPAGHPANIAKTIETVNTYKDDPNIFAWAIMDEPYSNDPGCAPYLEASYKAIRAIDDTHPIFIMQDGKNYNAAARYADILGIDPYPAGKETPTTHVYDRTAAAVLCGKPVYCLNQAFLYGGFFPSGAEIRNMTYQALLAGAQGIGYYAWATSDGPIPLYRTALWDYLPQWNDKEAPLVFQGIARGVPQINTSEVIQTARFSVAEKEYMVVRNRTNATQTAQAATGLTATAFVRMVGYGCETRVTDASAGVLTLSLPPAAAILLELVPQNDEILLCTGNMLAETVLPGTVVTPVFPDDNCRNIVAVYSVRDDRAELIQISYGDAPITTNTDMQMVKAFSWNAMLSRRKSATCYVLDGCK